jgi:Integrase core domain
MLLEAKVLIKRWQLGYNRFRLHSSLGYRPPAPGAIVPWTPDSDRGCSRGPLWRARREHYHGDWYLQRGRVQVFVHARVKK